MIGCMYARTYTYIPIMRYKRNLPNYYPRDYMRGGISRTFLRVLILFIVFIVTEAFLRIASTRGEDEMRLQVTERIVLIYSNVSVVGVGESIGIAFGENVTVKHCWECAANGAGLGQGMGYIGGGGGKRVAAETATTVAKGGSRSHV